MGKRKYRSGEHNSPICEGSHARTADRKRRKCYLDGLNSDYAAIKLNIPTRRALAREVEAWDVTNLDGFEK